MTLDDQLRFQGHAIIRRLISLISITPIFMLLLKTKRLSMLMGRNVRLSNLLISSCLMIGLPGNLGCILVVTNASYFVALSTVGMKSNNINQTIKADWHIHAEK